MSLEVKILGSNAAAPAHNRNQSAQIVRMNNLTFLVDCGESAQIQMKRYGVKINKITHVFISHLHGDHYYGLMGLLSTMHLYGRKKKLYLYGPPGLLEIISLQLRYSETSLLFDIVFHEWTPETSEILYEDNFMTVSTIPLDHRVPCSGFLFREKPKRRRLNKAAIELNLPPVHIHTLKDGNDVLDEHGKVKLENAKFTLPPRPSFSYAYCSDTRYNENLLHYITGIDLLYHEATFTEEFRDRAQETYHTTALGAATMAEKAKVGQLIIGHFSNRYRILDELLVEAKQKFERTSLAIEGETFIIDY